MPDDIGFIVEYIVQDSETYFHAIGRCGDRPIQVGDEFERIHAPSVVVRNAYQGLGEISPVKLRVERIQAYQRDLPMLGQGMTGTIDLCGDRLSRVVPGAVLGVPIQSASSPISAPVPAQQGNPVS